MRKIRNAIMILMAFCFTSVIFGEEIKTSEIFNWVASKMSFQIDPKIPLPEIKVASAEDLMEVAVNIIWRDFQGPLLKDFLKDLEKSQGQERTTELTKEEVIKELKNLVVQFRAQGEEDLVNNEGCYDPYENIIYLAKGSALWVLVHEAAHYFQVKYQKRYPENNEVFKNISPQKQEEILKQHQELEEEAKKIAAEWRKEFCPIKVEIFVMPTAPYVK